MRNFFLLLLLLYSISNLASAQWKQTEGPYTGRTTAMITLDNIIFAANREHFGVDGRIYKSKNFGKTWVESDKGMLGTYAYGFEKIGTHLFAAVPSDGVYRTDDFGENWRLKNHGLGEPIVLSLHARETILFAGMGGSGVARSTNLGNLWTFVNNGLPGGQVIVYDIQHIGRYVLIGLASGGGPAPLYRTSNDGGLWTLSNNGLPPGANIRHLTLSGSTLFASTEGVGISGNHEYGVYRSTDSGYTWVAKNNGIPEVLNGNTGEVFAAANGDLYLSTTFGNNNVRVYKSTNNGDNWFPSGDGLRPGQEAFSFTEAGTYVFAGTGNYSSVFRTANEGASWEEARKGLSNSSVYSLMKHDGRLYAGTEEGLFYTIDKGENWTEMQNGLPFGTPVTTMEKNESNIYLGTDQYGIYRSTNSGASWKKINKGLTGTFSLSINDILSYKNVLYTATWDGIYKSTNNGDKWTLASTGLPDAFGGIVEVNTIVAHNNILFAGTVLEKIYKSTNNGATWVFSGNGLSTYASTVHQILPVGNTLYAATDEGVYKSTNNGQSWEVTALNAGTVRKLESDENLIFASLYGPTILTGYNVFVSDDKDASWQEYTEGLFETSRVRAMLIDENIIYGGTDIRSVWKRNISDLLKEKMPVARKVNGDIDTKSFSVFAQNPFSNNIDIQLETKEAGKAFFYLTDATGKMMMQKESQITEGNNYLKLFVADLANGIYILNVRKGNETRNIKLVKK